MRRLLFFLSLFLVLGCSKEKTKSGPDPEATLIGRWVVYKSCDDYGDGGCDYVSDDFSSFRYRSDSILIRYYPYSDSIVDSYCRYKIVKIKESPDENSIEIWMLYSSFIYFDIPSLEDTIKFQKLPVYEDHENYFPIDYTYKDGKYTFYGGIYPVYYKKEE